MNAMPQADIEGAGEQPDNYKNTDYDAYDTRQMNNDVQGRKMTYQVQLQPGLLVGSCQPGRWRG